MIEYFCLSRVLLQTVILKKHITLGVIYFRVLSVCLQVPCQYVKVKKKKKKVIKNFMYRNIK